MCLAPAGARSRVFTPSGLSGSWVAALDADTEGEDTEGEGSRLAPWARPAKTKARALTSIFLTNYLPRSQAAGSWLGVLPRI